jgi:hypothetical protein
MLTACFALLATLAFYTPAAAQPGGRSVPKPYKEVITEKASTRFGLFTVHQVEGKYYFEIPDSLLGREILAVVRLSRTAAGEGYAGELQNQQCLVFEKGTEDHIFIRVVTVLSEVDTANAMSVAVRNSNLDPIAVSLPVAAYGPDGRSCVVDVTELFRADNVLTGLSNGAKKRLELSGQAADRSYISSMHTFPLNTEVRTVKTFMTTPAQPVLSLGGDKQPVRVGDAVGAITMEVNTSLLLLPKEPMLRRQADPRVGYFSDDVTEYGDDQQRVDRHSYIVRWRLEPKPADRERYRRGELVEPAKPIVYYIDPATPAKWRPYLIAGIEDWNKAFEKAGFLHAIRAREWPVNDTTMSLEDARFSVLRYFASDKENAYGPNVHDPRSGEILESHIGWYHNVMTLLHDWYMIQCGAVDARARTMRFDDSLMGALIRFVSSHEIGHTLGLRHNMGSSSLTPVALLRNKSWVEANGHTASIMDYARFNFVAQPEDGIGAAGLFPRIGIYDKWAIRWGYTYTGLPEKADYRQTCKWVLDSLKANPRLWFGGEGFNGDPRAQAEDLGDDPVKAGMYGIRNLKRILPQLPEWTREENDTYDHLKEMYGQLFIQFEGYMRHAVKYVGGVEETVRSVEQAGPVYTPVPKPMQHAAVEYLDDQLFHTPEWLQDRKILDKISDPSAGDAVGVLQLSTLRDLLLPIHLVKMLNTAERYGSDTYGPGELLDDLEKGIWDDLATGRPVTLLRRNLQKAYVAALDNLLNKPSTAQPSEAANSDAASLARSHLTALGSRIAATHPADAATQAHLKDIAVRINLALHHQ